MGLFWPLLVWMLPGSLSLWLLRSRVPVTAREVVLALLLTPIAILLGLILGAVERAKG